MVNYTAMANGGLAQIRPYQAGKPIEEVKRELGLEHVVKLASNENPYGISPRALKACTEMLANCHYYPDSHGFYLKQKLHEKFGFDPDCITLGDGSNELINLIFQTFVNDKVNVIIPELSFVVYNMEATIANAGVKTIPLKNYTVDLDAVLAAIDDRTRMIVLTNPGNPTGTAVPEKKLYAFVKKVPHEVLVVLDEAYNEFQGKDFVHSTDWLSECPNLIVCRTFSKAYGLAGLRIGYMLSNKEIASLINRLRAPFNVNAVAQSAALATLDDDAYLNNVIEKNAAERERYAAYCAKKGLKMIPSKTNFVAIDFGREVKNLYEALLKKGLIVRPMGGYGLDTILRISIGTHEENSLLFAALDELV